MKIAKLVGRNLGRRKARSVMTVLGVAAALCLLVAVDSLASGLAGALQSEDGARSLVVYRKNRYCPQTSILPEHYGARIAAVDGVESLLPVQVFLNNCRASLDLVVFHGAPPEEALAQRDLRLVAGSLDGYVSERDGALVGRSFAARRGLEPGDRFRFGDVDVRISGVFASSDSTQEGVVLVHLAGLQRAARRLGSVTQFDVRVAEGADPKAVAQRIDALFATAEEPTDTRPKSAHLESATADLVEMLRLGRWLALACLVVVLTLVANTVWMGVQERVRELGVLRAMGFREGHVLRLVLGEAVLLSALGAALGVGGALLVLRFTHISIGTEGIAIPLEADAMVALRGAALALLAGAAAGLLPALQSARRPVVEALHA
ncbi:MAG: FtsX-like permease family protein [Planctomycetaceae bacterium]|nr:FtsX-like permease family protein [Planctomycetaceae bacterium]